MRCKNCKTKNTKKANFCKNCGKEFTKVEKLKAETFSIKGVYDTISNIRKVPGLKFIYEHDLAKIAAILLVILSGVLAVLNKENTLHLVNSKSYSLEYNKNEKEYYILEEKNLYNENDKKINLNLNVPNKINNIYISLYEFDGDLIKEEKYNKKDKITLEANTNGNNYYLISDNKDYKNALKVKVYVY